jgi:hypothetical protein
MSDLNLLWNTSSNETILNLVKYLQDNIPEDVKINKQVDEFELFTLARNLSEHISELFKENNNILIVDNSIYYAGDLTKLNIKISIKVNSVFVFPNNFFLQQGFTDILNWETLGKLSNELFLMITQITADNLNKELQYRVFNTWDDRYYELYVDDSSILISEFEKTQLGRFIYLLYLRDKFIRDPNVCVIISDFIPLVNRVKEIEASLIKYSEDEFLQKYPAYKKEYPKLKKSYQRNKIYEFRLNLLLFILVLSSPSVSADLDQDTGQVTVNLTDTFKKLFNRCQQNNSRYIITFLAFRTESGGHANTLIVDKLEKNVERFEPNGYIPLQKDKIFGLISEQIDIQLRDYFSQIGYSYIPPTDFCPKMGIQQIESLFYKDTGFCVSWSIIYAEERLSSKVSRSYIAQNLIKDIISKYNLYNVDTSKLGQNVENWMKEYIRNIFSNMDVYYKEISKLLGIDVKYQMIESTSCLTI